MRNVANKNVPPVRRIGQTSPKRGLISIKIAAIKRLTAPPSWLPASTASVVPIQPCAHRATSSREPKWETPIVPDPS
jgi:hypothetical protein